MVGSEDQPSWRRVGPAPFGDLGQHVFDGSDAPVLIGDRDGVAAGRRDGGDGRVQVGLDVSLSIEAGEGVEVGIVLGEEAGKVSESGREARHRLGSTGAEFAFQIRDEQRSQRRRAVGESVLECVGLVRCDRWRVDDVEVEKHLVGAHDRAAIVPPSLPGCGFAFAACVGERVEVGNGRDGREDGQSG